VGVAAAGADQRIAVYGALDYASGHLVWQTASHKDGTGFAAFLEQIAQTWPQEDLVLVLDNVSDHRSAARRPWWTAQQGRLLPFWLPAYTPNLNLAGARLVLPHAATGLPSLLGRSGRTPGSRRHPARPDRSALPYPRSPRHSLGT
jgi:hypothetical protein